MIYFKNFDEWNLVKKSLNNNKSSKKFFYEREIWFCSIGINVGHEQDGKHERYERPVLIFKKINEKTFLGIPLASSQKRDIRSYYWNIKNRKRSILLFHQIRLLDSKRIHQKIDEIPSSTFEDIKRGFITFLNTGN
jgi:mRNA-degrading endonuclease toxin of MazEF toxin-antitoxin module